MSVGHSGSAYSSYGHEAELVMVDEMFEHPTSKWPTTTGYATDEVRDDTARMTSIATTMHTMLSTELKQATLVINPVDLDTYTLKKKINLQNLDKWSTIGLQIGVIQVDCTTNRMTLCCSNKLQGVARDAFKYYAYQLALWKRRMKDKQKDRRVCRLTSDTPNTESK